jgi:hypothetical protein
MPPYTAHGHFTAILSETDRRELAEQRIQRMMFEANVSLGPYQSNPRAVANDNAGRARAVVTSLYDTTMGIARALDQANRYTDPSLTPEGLAEARAERRAAVFKAVDSRLEGLLPHLDTAFTEADEAAAAFRPTFNPDDVAQAVRTDQAWARNVQPQLDKGKGWDQIIPNLDHDGLLAVERFAPGYESASRDRFTQHEIPASLAGIKTMSERRVLESAPEGPAREALAAFTEVQSYRAAAYATAATLGEVGKMDATNPASVDSTLTVAQIGIKRSTFAVGAQPVAAEPAA